MRSDDIIDLMRWTAAAWAQDELRPMVTTDANIEEAKRAADQDYWDVRDKGDMGSGIRAAVLTCKINDTTNDRLTVEARVDVTRGIGYVTAVFLTRDGQEHRHFNVPGTPFLKAKETWEKGRDESLKAAVRWYTKKFNPALDTDIGTLNTDWELFEHYRPSIQSQCYCWVWLRIKDRSSHSYEASFLDPGRVIVEICPGFDTTVSWAMPPRNDWVLAAEPPPAGYGDWK